MVSKHKIHIIICLLLISMSVAGMPGNATSHSFTYDADGNRMKMQVKRNGGVEYCRYYLGRYEADYEGSTPKSQRLYIGGDAYSAPAAYLNTGSGWKLHYICRDYLGSITHLIDANGAVVQELGYDAWGRLRDPATQQPYEPGGEPDLALGRGYTGHEHLPMFGLVNMNARLYDPAVGRFLSPDPFVQMPDFSQNFNRYSYCLNNPLKYTDPSGEIAWFVPIIIGAIIGGASYTASVGFSQGGFNNWNWGQFGKSVGFGAVSGLATYGVGQLFGAVGSMGIGGELARAYMHGYAQGLISDFSGGSFIQGFTSGGLGSVAGSAFMMYGGRFAYSALGTYTFSGLAGGIGAELTGGNFWQGTAIGFLSAGLNHLSQVVVKPSFDELLANFPVDEFGNELPSSEVYKLIGGKVLSEHLRDSKSFHNACALRVSKSLNDSGTMLPNIPGKTLKGADGNNYFFRAQDLYNWMRQSYGKPISTKNYSSLKGNKGIYIMQASYPKIFGAWGHATLYNMSGTIGNSFAGKYAYQYNLWGF